MQIKFRYNKIVLNYCEFSLNLKRSGDPGPTPEVGDPTPEGGGTTPEGSLTLVSNLLLVDLNIGLDMLGNFK